MKTLPESVTRFQSPSLPIKVSAGLQHCDHPYLLTPPLETSVCSDLRQSAGRDAFVQIQNQFKKIKRWRALNFYTAVLYASIPSNCYQNSRDAFAALNTLNTDETRDACLEKCLTVAKCSESFKEKGVLFIGAHLPLEAMHAWIIEDGYQPDDQDRQWINFLPLMAITRTNSFA